MKEENNISHQQTLQNRFPFLTYGEYAGNQYLGIVQNSDMQLLSMYVYSDIHDKKLKILFLKYGDIWWWESNRKIPINIFMKSQFKIFKRYLKTFSRKKFNVLQGPVISIQNYSQKRIKRKHIQLINPKIINPN